MKTTGDVLKKTSAGSGEDNIVHIEKQISQVVAPSKDKQGDVALRGDEAETVRVVSTALVPSPRSLLEAIEGLVEPTDMLRMIRVDEARWLLAVDHLVKITMEKGVLDVELVYRPCTRDGDAEDDADGGGLDDGAKCLVKVDARLLRKATNHPSSLVASKATIRCELMLEEPFA